MINKQRVLQMALLTSYVSINLGTLFYVFELTRTMMGAYGIVFIVAGLFIIIYFLPRVLKGSYHQSDIKYGRRALFLLALAGLAVGIFMPYVTRWYEPLIWANKVATVSGIFGSAIAIVALVLTYIVKS